MTETNPEARDRWPFDWTIVQGLAEEGLTPVDPSEPPRPGDVLIVLNPPDTAGWALLGNGCWYRTCAGDEPWPPPVPHAVVRPLRPGWHP